MSGSGTAGDPFVPVLILSEDADNAAECRDDGLYVAARVYLDHDFAVRSSTSITVNGTAWANLSTTLDISLAGVEAGDVVGVWASGLWGNEATEAYGDVVSVVGGAVQNSWAAQGAVEAGGFGIMAWRGEISVFDSLGGGTEKALVAGDIENGSALLRVRVRTSSATNKTLYGTSLLEFHWGARNYGPRS